MGMVHYDGKLGEFDYNDEEFCIMNVLGSYHRGIIDVINVDSIPGDFVEGVECLRYIGDETDLSKISIPDGLYDASGLFAGCPVTGVPFIPKSVEIIDYMFYGTNITQLPVFGHQIYSAYKSFANCKCLKDVVFNIDQCMWNIEPYMFCGSDMDSFTLKICDSNITSINIKTNAFYGCNIHGDMTLHAKGKVYIVRSALSSLSVRTLSISVSPFVDSEPSEIIFYETSFNCNIETLKLNASSISVSNMLSFLPSSTVGNMVVDCDVFDAFVGRVNSVKKHDFHFNGTLEEFNDCTFFNIANDIANDYKNMHFIYGSLGSLSSEKSLLDCITHIDNYAFTGSDVVNVDVPSSVNTVCGYAFYGCSSLKTINLNSHVKGIMDVINSISEDVKITYKGTEISSLLRKGKDMGAHYSYMEPFMYYCVDNDVFLSEDLLRNVISYSHQNSLWGSFNPDSHYDFEHVMDRYRTYGDMHEVSLHDDISEMDINTMSDLFLHNNTFHRHVPKCVDKLCIATHKLNTTFNDVVDNFDLKYTKRIIDEHKPVVPAVMCRHYFDSPTCYNLANKGLMGLMADAIVKYRESRKNCYKDVMSFVVTHTDSKYDSLKLIVDHAEYIDVSPKSSIRDLIKKVNYLSDTKEIVKIEDGYVGCGFKVRDCKCNIPVIKTEYNGRISRILDFNNESDLVLAANLGYRTECCQHFGGAGETAMMYGFLNADAGFWDMEDSSGNVKAQAMIFKIDNDTLVFDNIEFANTSSADYRRRIESLKADIAYFVENSGFKNVILGRGYVDLDCDAMEKADIPNLKLSADELFVLSNKFRNNRSFSTVQAASDFMSSSEYDIYNFLYTDTRCGCVYLKHDGVVSDYLLENFDKDLTGKVCNISEYYDLDIDDLYKESEIRRLPDMGMHQNDMQGALVLT